MSYGRLLIRLFSVLLVISGGLWTLQGFGFVNWPEQSFMIEDRTWSLIGAFTVLIGFVLMRVSRKP